MSHALYELAQNHFIQDKVRNEIRDELARNNGELDYEVVKSMTYLDMVFNGMNLPFKWAMSERKKNL